jgi:putative ABC transport system ATP-binding protein
VTALLDLAAVEKRYATGRTEVHALRGVDLVIERGEFVAVMGPSGSGKTTLMEILGCLSRPSEGRYSFDGRDVATIDADGLSRLRGESIGFVFQSFNLLARLTAVENVELPLVYRGVPRDERRARALEVLERVGLAARAVHRPAELSGGERQRVAIARALINRPALILADEPTGNLDTATGSEIMAMLHRLNGAGHTLVLVTHDPGVGDEARRRVRIRDGRIQADERSA